MTHKFQIGDIIALKHDPEYKHQIVDIIGNFRKLIKGPWCNGSKEYLVGPNSYIMKDLKTNKLVWDPIKDIHKNYQLIQQVKNEPLKWKNYEEILV